MRQSLDRWSIRTRITVGSVLVGLVVFAAVGLVLHLQVGAAVAETDRSLVRSDLAPFVQDLRQNADEAPDEPAAGALVAVRSADGRWLVDSLPPALRDALPPRAAEGTETVLQLRADGRTWTVAGSDVDGTVAWAARDTRGGAETLRHVDRSLVVGAALAVLALGAAAWLLTGLALRPVTRMRQRAEALADGAPGHLPVGPADDELSALARTLNRFVDRQHEDAERGRRMVSDASHELRTPLAALTARLELARRHRGDADALEQDLAAADHDAGRLAALAGSLLALSRLDDRTDPPVETTAADLVSELMTAVDRVRALPGADHREVDFTTEVPDPAAVYRLDAGAFVRVVDNLAANAITATPPGGSVRIALTQTAQDLVLCVVDDGPGVPASFLPRAFERFARADPARTSALGGSGLGLAIVRGTAERAGGTATLRNVGPTDREAHPAPGGSGAVAEVRIPRR